MTIYCKVVDGVIVEEGNLPLSARRLDTSEWVMGLLSAPAELRQACGYFAVVDVARPVSTASDWTRTVELVNGTPTVVWTARPWTAEELAARQAEAARIVKAANLSPAAVTWLRQQAATAASTTATSGNAVTVLNGILDNLAIFYDRFADLVEAHGFVRE